jgi:hypothetical protein
LADWADTGSAMPSAPIAKTAVPLIAVFLTNSLRVIPLFTSSDNLMANSYLKLMQCNIPDRMGRISVIHHIF